MMHTDDAMADTNDDSQEFDPSHQQLEDAAEESMQTDAVFDDEEQSLNNSRSHDIAASASVAAASPSDAAPQQPFFSPPRRMSTLVAERVGVFESPSPSPSRSRAESPLTTHESGAVREEVARLEAERERDERERIAQEAALLASQAHVHPHHSPLAADPSYATSAAHSTGSSPSAPSPRALSAVPTPTPVPAAERASATSSPRHQEHSMQETRGLLSPVGAPQSSGHASAGLLSPSGDSLHGEEGLLSFTSDGQLLSPLRPIGGSGTAGGDMFASLLSPAARAASPHSIASTPAAPPAPSSSSIFPPFVPATIGAHGVLVWHPSVLRHPSTLLSSMLTPHADTLHTLILDGQSSEEQQGAGGPPYELSSLALALRDRCPALQSLVLRNFPSANPSLSATSSVPSLAPLAAVQSLTSLSVTHCSLTSLAALSLAHLGTLPRLRRLDLSHNGCTTLGVSVRCLEQLEELRLEHNSLHASELAHLPSLRMLRVLTLWANPAASDTLALDLEARTGGRMRVFVREEDERKERAQQAHLFSSHRHTTDAVADAVFAVSALTRTPLSSLSLAHSPLAASAATSSVVSRTSSPHNTLLTDTVYEQSQAARAQERHMLELELQRNLDAERELAAVLSPAAVKQLHVTATASPAAASTPSQSLREKLAAENASLLAAQERREAERELERHERALSQTHVPSPSQSHSRSSSLRVNPDAAPLRSTSELMAPIPRIDISEAMLAEADAESGAEEDAPSNANTGREQAAGSSSVRSSVSAANSARSVKSSPEGSGMGGAASAGPSRSILRASRSGLMPSSTRKHRQTPSGSAAGSRTNSPPQSSPITVASSSAAASRAARTPNPRRSSTGMNFPSAVPPATVGHRQSYSALVGGSNAGGVASVSGEDVASLRAANRTLQSRLSQALADKERLNARFVRFQQRAADQAIDGAAHELQFSPLSPLASPARSPSNAVNSRAYFERLQSYATAHARLSRALAALHENELQQRAAGELLRQVDSSPTNSLSSDSLPVRREVERLQSAHVSLLAEIGAVEAELRDLREELSRADQQRRERALDALSLSGSADPSASPASAVSLSDALTPLPPPALSTQQAKEDASVQAALSPARAAGPDPATLLLELQSTREHAEALQSQLDQLARSHQAWQEQAEQTHAQLEQARATAEQAQAQLDQLKAQAEQAQTRAEQSESLAQQAESRAEQLSGELRQAHEQLALQRHSSRVMEDQLGAQEARLADLDRLLAQQRSETQSLAQAHAQCMSQQAALTEAQQSSKTANEELTQARAILRYVESQLAQERAEKESLHAQLAVLEATQTSSAATKQTSEPIVQQQPAAQAAPILPSSQPASLATQTASTVPAASASQANFLSTTAPTLSIPPLPAAPSAAVAAPNAGLSTERQENKESASNDPLHRELEPPFFLSALHSQVLSSTRHAPASTSGEPDSGPNQSQPTTKRESDALRGVWSTEESELIASVRAQIHAQKQSQLPATGEPPLRQEQSLPQQSLSSLVQPVSGSAPLSLPHSIVPSPPAPNQSGWMRSASSSAEGADPVAQLESFRQSQARAQEEALAAARARDEQLRAAAAEAAVMRAAQHEADQAYQLEQLARLADEERSKQAQLRALLAHEEALQRQAAASAPHSFAMQPQLNTATQPLPAENDPHALTLAEEQLLASNRAAMAYLNAQIESLSQQRARLQASTGNVTQSTPAAASSAVPPAGLSVSVSSTPRGSVLLSSAHTQGHPHSQIHVDAEEAAMEAETDADGQTEEEAEQLPSWTRTVVAPAGSAREQLSTSMRLDDDGGVGETRDNLERTMRRSSTGGSASAQRRSASLPRSSGATTRAQAHPAHLYSARSGSTRVLDETQGRTVARIVQSALAGSGSTAGSGIPTSSDAAAEAARVEKQRRKELARIARQSQEVALRQARREAQLQSLLAQQAQDELVGTTGGKKPPPSSDRGRSKSRGRTPVQHAPPPSLYLPPDAMVARGIRPRSASVSRSMVDEGSVSSALRARIESERREEEPPTSIPSGAYYADASLTNASLNASHQASHSPRSRSRARSSAATPRGHSPAIAGSYDLHPPAHFDDNSAYHPQAVSGLRHEVLLAQANGGGAAAAGGAQAQPRSSSVPRSTGANGAMHSAQTAALGPFASPVAARSLAATESRILPSSSYPTHSPAASPAFGGNLFGGSASHVLPSPSAFPPLDHSFSSAIPSAIPATAAPVVRGSSTARFAQRAPSAAPIQASPNASFAGGLSDNAANTSVEYSHAYASGAEALAVLEATRARYRAQKLAEAQGLAQQQR